ncbi:MAG TPA: DUF5654 family protein [Patescibacteria group bacterium]
MKSQVVQRLSDLVTAALGLVAALAWNDAVQVLFAKLFGAPDQLTAKLIYAVTVTVIAVVAAIWIGRVAQKLTPKEKKELSQK